MAQARFVFGNQVDRNNEVPLFDVRRGRNEIIAMVDVEYVALFEKLLNPPTRDAADALAEVLSHATVEPADAP